MPRLTHIYRHPIKALGYETISSAKLTPNETLPGDRLWAVEHEASKFDPETGWGRCQNFIRGASSSQLMAIRIETLEDGTYRLSHPVRPDLTFNPDANPEVLIDWVAPICNPDRAQPVKLVAATKQGMTDNSNPYVSIMTAASLDAVSNAAGTTLIRERFRGNLWLEGTQAWEEFDWFGKRIKIGTSELEVVEPVERCVATHVDPTTGHPDTNVLSTLEQTWNHRNFGVFARVIKGGEIAPGAQVTLP